MKRNSDLKNTWSSCNGIAQTANSSERGCILTNFNNQHCLKYICIALHYLVVLKLLRDVLRAQLLDFEYRATVSVPLQGQKADYQYITKFIVEI